MVRFGLRFRRHKRPRLGKVRHQRLLATPRYAEP